MELIRPPFAPPLPADLRHSPIGKIEERPHFSKAIDEIHHITSTLNYKTRNLLYTAKHYSEYPSLFLYTLNVELPSEGK